MELFARVLTGVVAAWIPIDGVKAKLDVQTWSAGVARMTDTQGRESVRLELSPHTVNKNPG